METKLTLEQRIDNIEKILGINEYGILNTFMGKGLGKDIRDLKKMHNQRLNGNDFRPDLGHP